MSRKLTQLTAAPLLRVPRYGRLSLANSHSSTLEPAKTVKWSKFSEEIRDIHFYLKEENVSASFERLCGLPSSAIGEIPRYYFSRLLTLASNETTMPPKAYFRRIFQTAVIMRKAGIVIRPEEYAILISSASRANKTLEVMYIWREVKMKHAEGKIRMTTQLYNAFIRATCPSNPRLWSRFVTGASNSLRKQANNRFPSHSVNDLTQEMTSNGVMVDAETIELAILQLGHNGYMKTIEQVINQLWDVNLGGSASGRKMQKGSKMWPKRSLVTSLIHCYGVNGQLEDGIRMANKFREAYGISTLTEDYWLAVLRWASIDALTGIKNGDLANFDPIFIELWHACPIKHTLSMHALKREIDMKKGNYEAVVKQSEAIFATCSEDAGEAMASVTKFCSKSVWQVARALAIRGDGEKARELVNEWSAKSAVFEDLKGKLKELEIRLGVETDNEDITEEVAEIVHGHSASDVLRDRTVSA